MNHHIQTIHFLFSLIILVLFSIGCQGTNEITQKIVEKPYWCLTEVTENGTKKDLYSQTGFTLYSDGSLSGHFPVNGFSGKMTVGDEGTIHFEEVRWTSMAAQDPKIMDEEIFIQKAFMGMKLAKLENEKLIMDDGQVVLSFSICDFGYMKNLQANKWKLVGTETKQEQDVMVAYKDPKEQYKNLSSSKDKITLECSKKSTYVKNTNEIVYDISGNLGEETYSGKLAISKLSGKLRIYDIKKQSTRDNAYINHLENLRNFSFMHNNLHVDTTAGTTLVFKAN